MEKELKNKVVIVFAIFFALQMIVSCCPESTYEYTVTGVSTRALKLEGNNFVAVSSQDLIQKEEVILEIIFEGTEVQVSHVMKEVSKLGVQSAYAAIDCEDATINYKNKVDRVEIFAVDANSTEVEVTHDAVIQGSQESIASYIAANILSVRNGLAVSFSNVSNIPSEASFRIRAFLSDNTVVEAVTNQVSFN